MFLFKKLNRKYTIIYGHNVKNLNKKNFYFITENFLPYLKSEIFISNYICRNFPKNSKKIYLHHCIYDTPLTGIDKEKETFNSLLNYNYIFLSSQKMIQSFHNYFNLDKIDKIKFFSSGYPRLDYLEKKSKFIRKKNSIILAIANIIAYPDHSIIKNLIDIVKVINLNFNYDIILRPHPSNRKIFNNQNFSKLFDLINQNKNIKVDFRDNYLESYNKSLLMITDISGTAYTFSFLTGSPVLFFSRNEKKAVQNYSNLKHFQDRKKIGYITNDLDNLKNIVKKLIKNKNNIKKKIFILKKQRLDFIGKTQDRFSKLIQMISEN